MDDPIITFGSESLIIEMFPDLIHVEKEKEKEKEKEEPVAVEEPKKSWCSIS